MKLAALWLAVLITSAAFGQHIPITGPPGVAGHIYDQTTAPAGCNQGDIYYNTSTDTTYTCGSSNNWSSVASGSGTVVSPIEDKGGQVFNVKAYGAKGDGTTDDYTAIAATITAAQAAGGIVYFPQGTYLFDTTITLSLAQSGLIFQGVGHYYSAAIGTILKWGGAANGTMIKLDGCNNVHFQDMVIDPNSLAGRAIQLISSAQSTAHNTFERIYIRSVTGTPGYAISVGETAVANVSENLFDDIRVLGATTSFYQTGAQSFSWVSHFYMTSNTDGFNIRDGWFTASHFEYGGTGNAVRVGDDGNVVNLIDWDWEGTGTFLIEEDAASSNYPVINIDKLRALYGTNGSPGTIAQIGTSAGAQGFLRITNSKFGTTYAASNATIAIIAKSGASLTFTDLGNAYYTSPSTTAVTFSGSGTNIHTRTVQSTEPIASAGAVRLGSSDTISFRNNANNADLSISKTGAASGNFPADSLSLSNFGAVKGIFAATTGSNPATAGTLRLSNADSACWRNAANNTNICNSLNSSNIFTLGAPIQTTGVRSGSASNTDLAGSITMSAGSGSYTFTGTYTSAPICIVQDDTALGGLLSKTVSTTTLSVTAGTSDVVEYICTGRN